MTIDWVRYVGIDPGAHAGLVCVSLPRGVYELSKARLVGFADITTGTSVHESRPQLKSRLFHRIRAQLLAWRPSVVVLEEPWDALPSFGQGKRGKAGHGRGTLFGLGAAYGLALAAASDLPSAPTLASYPVTSARAKPGKAERLGWMQRRMSKAPPHERTALRYALELHELKQRPESGVLPTAEYLAREEDDNVYMALGVLDFHLDRERGAV